MAGSISISLDQLLNNLGTPLAGGFVYFFQAGTTTPQSAYQDDQLTIVHPNPIELNSVGFVPQLYFADGFIKIRVTDANGVEILAQDNILVVGPSSGSGGVSVDATTVFSTGDLKSRYGTGVHSGWVRCAGRTIGSATSGASERANADCQSLFEFLWTNDSNLSVSGGRGASANADWSANKTIALPDWRGRLMGFLDDMGNSAAGTLTTTYYGTSPIVLGAAGGSQSHANTTGEMAAHSHTITDPGHFHTTTNSTVYAGTAQGLLGLGAADSVVSTVDLAGVSTGSKSTGISGTNSSGSGTAYSIITPTRLATLYIKL